MAIWKHNPLFLKNTRYAGLHDLGATGFGRPKVEKLSETEQSVLQSGHAFALFPNGHPA